MTLIVTPVLYLHSEFIRSSFAPFTGQGSGAQVSHMASLVEVSIGVNLALSVWTAFSDSITEAFRNLVKDLDPTDNPTFLEAIKEVAESQGEQTGTPLITEKFIEKYQIYVKRHIAEFDRAVATSTKQMKILAVISAFSSFLLLIGIAKNPELSIPGIIFWVISFSVAIPILLHVSVIYFFYIAYSMRIQCLDEKNGAAHYNAIVKATLAVYKRLQKEARQAVAKI